MKTKLTSSNRSNGTALMLAMIMAAIALLIMAAVMNRTSTVSKLNDRNNRYNVCNTVAAAGVEKVYARIAFDFQNYGLGQVTNNIGIYVTNVPTAGENPYWGNFVFADAQGNQNRIYVNYLTNYSGAMPSQYTNLSTVLAPIYRIIANVYQVGFTDIVGTAQEDVLLSMVPITTYAIFYNGDMEFSQCATMVVRGRVHSNGQVAVGTSSALTNNGVVSATKTVDSPPKDGLTFSPWLENSVFNAGYVTNIPSVTVAMTMTNSHAIIDLPPSGETPTSTQGLLREYNQANIIIIVTNQPAVGSTPPTPQVTITLQASQNGVIAGADTSKVQWGYIYTNISATPTNLASAVYVFTNYFTFAASNTMLGQVIPGYSNEPPTQAISAFLSLTNRFTDMREYRTNFYCTQIDIGAFAAFLTNNSAIMSKFNNGGIYPTILYVTDRRNVGTNKMSAVRLVNAARLPYNNHIGFSVATPNPLYTFGNYNVTADGVHYAYTPDSTTNNKDCTVPAALLCDAITILSAAFKDATSSNIVGTSSVSNTVNAAIITGNMPSTGTDATTFSGGVHNLMRMLEDWSSAKLILNTSIVVLWSSQMATNQFRNPIGWTSPSPINPYYKPPNPRQWGFDPNFYNPALQPPGVPQALVPIRFNWTIPPPNNTNSYIGNY